jgi:hypothetical protein
MLFLKERGIGCTSSHRCLSIIILMKRLPCYHGHRADRCGEPSCPLNLELWVNFLSCSFLRCSLNDNVWFIFKYHFMLLLPYLHCLQVFSAEFYTRPCGKGRLVTSWTCAAPGVLQQLRYCSSSLNNS